MARNRFASGRWAIGLILVVLLAACRSQNRPIVGDTAPNLLKIEVVDDGLYQITAADLQTAGWSLEELDANQLHLSQAGTAVPYHIKNDALIFYGQAPDSRYTAVRPYILESGKVGVTMMETAIAPGSAPTQAVIFQSRHIEENHLYLSDVRQNDQSDVWFWQTLGQSQKLTLSVELAAVVGDEPAILRLNLLGATLNPAVELDHDFDLIVNGQKLETIRWDGQTMHTSETALPPNLLQAGANEIVLDNEVEGASFLDIMELNWLELDYTAPATAVNDRLHFSQTEGAITLTGFSDRPLIFDISNGAAPHLLTNWLYEDNAVQLTDDVAARVAAVGPRGFLEPAAILPLRQSDWRSPDNQADMLIVTTDELSPALTPLVEARQAQELSVAVVPVAEIYDEFGYGVASPESVQTFIAFAVANWQTPPNYLFLVGEATTDYRDYQGIAPRNHVPSLLVPVDFSGETVSDSRLADVDGDKRPDLAVGRWPVDSVEDVENLVTRTLAYEEGTAVNRALFTADGTESQFAGMANRLWTNSGLTDDETLLLTGAAAEEVADAWNEGGWLTTYIGHGSVERWGKEDIFNTDTVSQLSAETPPIVLQLTCLTGLFAHPELTSLSETMLRHENGPVLLVAATSLTLSGNQEPFALSLMQRMQDPTYTRIGDAFQAAKLDLAIENNNGLREISDTFALLGDPSALMVRP